MITNSWIFAGGDEAVEAFVLTAYPDYWDGIPFDTEPAAQNTRAVTKVESA